MSVSDMNSRQEWAKRMLLEEIQDGFQRALQFTWFQSRLPVLAFLELPLEEQGQLAPYLPTGARFSGPPFDAIRGKLPQAAHALIRNLDQAITRRLDYGVPGEARGWALFALGNHKQKAARQVAKELISSLRECAESRGYRTSLVEPRILWVTERIGSGGYLLEFDALSPFAVWYDFREGKPGEGLTSGASYLQMLGCGSSGWCSRSAEEAPGVAAKALDFCEWHIAGMDKAQP